MKQISHIIYVSASFLLYEKIERNERNAKRLKR